MGGRYIGKKLLPHYWVLHIKGLDGFFHQVLLLWLSFVAFAWLPNR